VGAERLRTEERRSHEFGLSFLNECGIGTAGDDCKIRRKSHVHGETLEGADGKEVQARRSFYNFDRFRGRRRILKSNGKGTTGGLVGAGERGPRASKRETGSPGGVKIAQRILCNLLARWAQKTGTT